MNTPFRVIESSYVIDNRYLRLRSDTIELADGTLVRDYYVRESRGFVVIFAVTDSNEVILVRQYKHGIGKELLELPAGAIDPGESAHDAALRELREETGYEAHDLRHVRSFVVDPTNADTVAHLFFAQRVICAGVPAPEPTERITVEYASMECLTRMVREGTIDSMPHVAAIYLILDANGRLYDSRA